MHVFSTTIESLTLEDFITPVKYKAPILNIQSQNIDEDSLTVEDFTKHSLYRSTDLEQ